MRSKEKSQDIYQLMYIKCEVFLVFAVFFVFFLLANSSLYGQSHVITFPNSTIRSIGNFFDPESTAIYLTEFFAIRKGNYRITLFDEVPERTLIKIFGKIKKYQTSSFNFVGELYRFKHYCFDGIDIETVKGKKEKKYSIERIIIKKPGIKLVRNVSVGDQDEVVLDKYPSNGILPCQSGSYSYQHGDPCPMIVGFVIDSSIISRIDIYHKWP